MSYGSFIVKSLNLVVLLPFILIHLPAEEIALWYLFAAIASFQLLIDLGFSPTFSRLVAYTMGGAEVSTLMRPQGKARGNPNWESLERTCSTMLYIYSRLGGVWFLLLISIGTLAIIKPVSMIENNLAAWFAWIVVIGSSTISFFGISYSSYLQGINEIAVLRRWEMITSIGSTITSVSTLLLNGDLLAVIVSQQAWVIIGVARNRWLSRRALGGRMRAFSHPKKDEEVLRAAWPSTWRTGIGALTGYGLVQASGIIYAQIVTPSQAATYFLALRLIQAVSQFSQAPFYSKLPTLARMYSEGKNAELIPIAQKGMSLAYISYVAGFIVLGAFGGPLLEYIGSNVPFPDFLLWALIGLAFYFERYGAMHINFYSITNIIINHIANCVSGLIYIAVSIAGYRYLGIYAFPVALIVGNVGFYSWYAAKHSYAAFGLSFFTFERSTMLLNLGVLVLYILCAEFL